MNTTEGNKLIAEFMGKPFYHCEYCGSDFYNEDCYNCQTSYKDKLPQYHSSWDWLMPVVSKIGVTKPYNSELKIEYLGLFTPITEVWKAVIQFIQWYNLNK